jgi:hypothetical protein
MLIPAFLELVRDQITDESSVRWADAELIEYASAGQRQMWLDHPEALMGGGMITTIPDDLPTTSFTTTALDVDDAYANALIHFVCWMVFMEDSEDAQNAKSAESHYAIYNRIMGE